MKRLTYLVLFGLLGSLAQNLHAQDSFSTDPYTIVEDVVETAEPTGSTWLEEFDPYREHVERTPTMNKVRVPDQTMWDYPHLREADVSWMTRYERIIDTRQKMNILLRYPKLNVFDLMMKLALMPDGPNMYADRDFKDQMTDQRLKDLLTFEEWVDVMDPVTGDIVPQAIKGAIELESMVKLQIMEDWVFDKTHGRMYPRIVAIAIVYKPVVAGGSVELPEQPLFWMKYNDIRPYFANAEVFNRNMASRISVDHFFQARMFDSQIIKEPNVNDWPLKYYPEYEDNGIAALLKSEEIKNDLFVMEHDLWEY
ncbi:MAG: gliding motility protein GldN [Bacteroidota bacterium]|nr:gliding motility protein GldN [Bacteroidota bacterium]MDX5430212.1 gliding motility protein GldN [Bacteroidota bacterium]MDX5468974.1 gliding motility protein GldN [Bacteroidota bacterium]